MSLPALIGLLIASVLTCYVVAPLLWPQSFGATSPEEAPSPSAEDEILALEDLRDDLYTRILDLDFEQATGKSDEEEYLQERAALKRRTLAVLRTLDEHVAAAEAGANGDLVEREIQLARARRAAARTAMDDDRILNDEIERQVLALRRDRQTTA